MVITFQYLVDIARQTIWNSRILSWTILTKNQISLMAIDSSNSFLWVSIGSTYLISCNTEDWIESFEHTNQMFYRWASSPILGFLKQRSLYVAQGFRLCSLASDLKCWASGLPLHLPSCICTCAQFNVPFYFPKMFSSTQAFEDIITIMGFYFDPFMSRKNTL